MAPQQFAQFGSMEDAKDELMAMERVLLQTIKFDFNIEHAHKELLIYVRFNSSRDCHMSTTISLSFNIAKNFEQMF